MLVSGGKIVFFHVSVLALVCSNTVFLFFFTACSLEEEEGSDTDALPELKLVF